MELQSNRNSQEHLNALLCRDFQICSGWFLLASTIMLWCLSGCSQNESKKEGAADNKTEKKKQISKSGEPVFEVVSAESGFEFRHTLGTQDRYLSPDSMVAGCGVFDFNRDGLLDLLLVDSGDFKFFFDEGKKEDLGKSRLFQQISPGKFKEVSEQVGLKHKDYGTGVTIGDINNDGFDDLFFTNYGDDRLLINEGGKTFRDVTQQSGIKNSLWAGSATFFDFDRDGLLDLYVCNYVSYHQGTNCNSGGEAEDFCGPQVFRPTYDKLYRNVSRNSEIRFEDVSVAMGITAKQGPGLGVVARDFNLDGYVDLYVANDGASNFLWINQEGKKFEDKATQLGCAFGIKGESQAGMGLSVADLDGNGVQDIVVTHLENETNAAYLGNIVDTKNGKQLYFTESGGETGVQKISREMTGFGVATPDLDNDGDHDILTANGRVRRKQRKPKSDFWSDYKEPNQISINQGTGKFKELSAADPFTSHLGVSRGMALLDFDNDGKLDCLVTNADDQALLYRNRMSKTGNWVGIQAVNPEYGGRNAFGAVVKLEIDSDKTSVRTIQSDGSYLSASDPRAHFGLGAHDSIKRVVVTWTDQSMEAFQVDQINQYHTLEKGKGESVE